MKPEIKNALRNIDVMCANARLTRGEHAELARDVKLISDALEAAETKAKPKPVKEKKNGK